MNETNYEFGRDLSVVAIGDALVALEAAEPLSDAPSFARSQQGDALLAAVAAARLGMQAAFVTRIGDDPFGDWFVESWESEGLHLDYARRVAGRNGIVLSGGPPDARQIVAFRDGAAAAGLDESDVAPVPWELVRFVYAPGATQALSGSARHAVASAFEQARANGARAVYDPTLRPGVWPDEAAQLARSSFEELIDMVDLLIISAPLATGRLLAHASAADAARAARARGVAQIVVRDGARGCVVAEGGRIDRVVVDSPTAPRGSAIRTASFNGGLMAGLSMGLSLEDAAQAALDASAAAGRSEDSFEGIASLTEVNDLRRRSGREPLKP